MLKLTLLYFVVQNAILVWCFTARSDLAFPLLALVNLVAGPAALVLFCLPASRRKGENR